MENRVRRENGLADNNRDAGAFSPTGTRAGDDPLLAGGTPAEGEPGEARSTFRRWGRGGGSGGDTSGWGRSGDNVRRGRSGGSENGRGGRSNSSGGGDTPGWGRSGYARDPGFGGSEYGGGGYDEREGWRERDASAWGRDEQNEGRTYQSQRDQGARDSGWRERERGGGDRERDRDRNEERRHRPWWQRESLTVRDVMTSNVKSVAPDASARDIAEIMKQEDVGVVPVVRPDGRLLGLVTDRDLVIRGLTGGRSLNDARAEELATTDIEVIGPEDRLSNAIDLMGQQQVRRVPVVDDDDRLVGIIAMADIARHADYHEDLQEALEKISGRRSFWSRIWR